MGYFLSVRYVSVSVRYLSVSHIFNQKPIKTMENKAVYLISESQNAMNLTNDEADALYQSIYDAVWSDSETFDERMHELRKSIKAIRKRHDKEWDLEYTKIGSTIDIETVYKALGVTSLKDYHLESVSSHRGVIILTGERSYPNRLIEYLDKTMDINLFGCLVAAWDWKGSITFFWDASLLQSSDIAQNSLPDGVQIPDGDYWNCTHNFI